MKRLLSLLCLSSLVACASLQTKQSVKESKHRVAFSAEIEVPSHRKRPAGSIHLLMQAKKKSPEQATLLIENMTKIQFPKGCQEATLFADGEAVSLGSIKRTAARDGFSDALSTTIPSKGLAQLSSAHTINGEACGISFSLSEPQVNALHQMTNALSTEEMASR